MTKTASPTATCTRCRATLRSAASITRGMGAHCARIARKEAAIVTHKPAQIAKAMELIADKAITPVRGRRIFQVVSSKGDSRYLTAPQACNCAAGLKGKHVCYHRIAATYLAA